MTVIAAVDDAVQCCVQIQIGADLDHDPRQQPFRLIGEPHKQLIELLVHPADQPALSQS